MNANKFIFKILPHVSTVISFMILTFCIIDMQNNAMAFLDNSMTRGLLIIFSLISITINCAIYLKQGNTADKPVYAPPAERRAEALEPLPVQTCARVEAPAPVIVQSAPPVEKQDNATDAEIDEKLKILLENQKKLSENIEILAKLQSTRNNK